MTASPQTRDLRRSLAIDAGSPPSPSDFNQWTLCRRTGRSHSNLLAIAALVGGDYVAFLESLGYNPDADPTRNLDNRYWRNICYYLQSFIPQFEAYIMDELAAANSANDEKLLAGFSSMFSISMDKLRFCLENETAMRRLLDTIRPTVGVIAEINVSASIINGDVATSKWLLPRTNKDYALPDDNTPANNIPREIRIIRGNEDD